MSKKPFELSPETLIKRVMSGTVAYRTKDYLDAFKNLPCNELHSSSDYFETVKLWNDLQSTPPKVRYMTLSVTQRIHFVKEKIAEYYSDAKWAYIVHDKDTSAERKHLHAVLIFGNPRSLKSVATSLELPLPMVQKVWSKKGILDYLTHENSPEKHHYSLSEITANFDVEEEKKSDDNNAIDVMQEFDDYCAMREGRMSKREWIEKYSRCIVRH